MLKFSVERDLAVWGRKVRTAGDLLELQRAEGRDALLNCVLGDGVTAAMAANEMGRRGAGCVVVVDAKGHLHGVFSGRDFVRGLVVPDDADLERGPSESGSDRGAAPDAAGIVIDDIMSSAPKAGKSHWTIERCARIMLRRDMRYLPIVDPDTRTLLGVVSFGDVARALVRANAKDAPPSGLQRVREFFSVLGAKEPKKEAQAQDKAQRA
jgi:CBS domain-containing protein